MKNLAEEKPTDTLSGRTKFTVEQFVGLKDIKNKRVLNIGCGFGWFEYFALNNKVKQMVVVEPEEKDLMTINSYLFDERLETKIGSALNLKFPDASFDTITCWEVLEHIPIGAEKIMFREVKRLLKPGGRFYLSTPNENFTSKILDPAWWLIGHRHYSCSQIEKYAQRAGFVVKRIEKRGGWWELIFMLNLYVAKWIMRRQPCWNSFFREKLDQEFDRPLGFTNLFVELVRIDK